MDFVGKNSQTQNDQILLVALIFSGAQENFESHRIHIKHLHLLSYFKPYPSE